MISKKRTNLPVRKRKINDAIIEENIPDGSQSADSDFSSPCKKTKENQSSILDIALSLTNLSNFKNTEKPKQESPKFPETLMTILSDEIHVDSIRWVPGEDLFFFVDSNKFVEEVLPLYFRKTKFASFTRRLSRWGFRQVKKGSHAGCFFHPLFLQNNKALCKKMVSPSNAAANFVEIETPDYFKNDESEIAICERKFLPINKESHLPGHRKVSFSSDEFYPSSTASYNNGDTTNHISNLAYINDVSINRSMMLNNQTYTNCINPNVAPIEANPKNNDMEKLYKHYFNNMTSNDHNMTASMIANASSRMSYASAQESLIRRALLRSKLRIPNQERLPYLISSKIPMLRRSLFARNQFSLHFPVQINRHKDTLSSCGTASLPQPSSDEVVRRAVEVLYNC